MTPSTRLHALRIAHHGRELLTSGRISLPVEAPEGDRLMEVRRGQVPLGEVIDRLQRQSRALEQELLAADLPEQPDRDRVDRFLVSAYQRAWAVRRSG